MIFSVNFVICEHFPNQTIKTTEYTLTKFKRIVKEKNHGMVPLKIAYFCPKLSKILTSSLSPSGGALYWPPKEGANNNYQKLNLYCAQLRATAILSVLFHPAASVAGELAGCKSVRSIVGDSPTTCSAEPTQPSLIAHRPTQLYRF